MLMKKRQTSLSGSLALQQKHIIQSFLQYLPLQEAARSAQISRSWRNATQDGLRFHPARLELQFDEGGWTFVFPQHHLSLDWIVVASRIALDDFSEPRRSHLLQIAYLLYFDGWDWRSPVSSLTETPLNLKVMEFKDAYIPTQAQFLDLSTKVDLSNIEELKIESDFSYDSIQIEHFMNSLPSLKRLHLDLPDIDIDFNKVIKTIETFRFYENKIPHLHGKVKILELEEEWHDCFDLLTMNLEKIQGVEKIVWSLDCFIQEDARADYVIEVSDRLLKTMGPPFKTLVIPDDGLEFSIDCMGKIKNYFDLHVPEKWEFSMQNDQIFFKKIGK